MYSNSELPWEEVQKLQKLADEIVFKVTGKHLNDKETAVLKGAVDGKSYDEIGKATGFTSGHLNKDVGNPLWKKLSKGTGENVSKTNFVQALKRYGEKQASSLNNASLPEATPMPMEEAQNSESSGEQVLLDSQFYIKRHNVESLCYETIIQPGALIRIKSPQGMGKTLLLGKLLDYAAQQGYRIAKLDLKLVESSTLADIKSFLQWLCVEVCSQLEIQANLEEYWQDIIGSKKNCYNYFQRYLLSNSDETPLVLAIDNCEILFKFPNIFSEFFPLLRVWYENARQGGRVGNIWKNLRVILVYSTTETYPELDQNHSPFNVGEPILLPDFELSEITTLAKQYKLDEQLGEKELHQLMNLVGGHPYLIQQTLIILKRQPITLDQILRLGSTEQGIYSDHLRKQLWNLQQNSQLKSAYREVVMSNQPVGLDSAVAFKLWSMGLTIYSGNDCIPRYNLYRQYFSIRLE